MSLMRARRTIKKKDGNMKVQITRNKDLLHHLLLLVRCYKKALRRKTIQFIKVLV